MTTTATTHPPAAPLRLAGDAIREDVGGIPVDLAARDRIERGAMADMFRAAPRGLATALGIAVREDGEALMLGVEAVPTLVLNRAMCLGPSAGDVARQVAALRGFLGRRPHIAALAADADEDASEALVAAGYAPGYPWDVFVHDGAAPPPAPAGPAVDAPAPGPEAREAGEIVRFAFGLPSPVAGWVAALAGRPGWAVMRARDGDAAIGAGVMRIDGSGAWLGLGATLPDHRGKGAQGALFAARIAAARAAGCAVVTTETGAPGEAGPGPSYRNMLRAGFTPVGRRVNWSSPGA